MTQQRYRPASDLETLMSIADPPQDHLDHPVSMVIARRPMPGRQAELGEWANQISAAASGFAGNLGAVIYPPSPPERDELVIAFSFATAEELAVWEHSDAHREWIERSASLISSSRSLPVTGFESLFVRAGGAGAGTPSRWKTATIIALSVYPMSLLINWLLAQHIAAWNLFLRVLLTTVIVVAFVVWVGVPLLSRYLGSWLRGKRPASGS